MMRENSKSNYIEFPINRGISYEKINQKKKKKLKEKTLLTLC